MKVTVFLILVCLIICCKDPSDRYVKRFDKVDISKTSIPDTAVNQEFLQIRAKAQAENGCWSHLYFELKKTKDFEYTLKAYGTYESFGICPDKVVTKDTVIDFLPKQAGTYRFLISAESGKTEKDSIVVVE
ncbi:MAG: hypothetical protein ACM3O8_12835 [Methylococcaceae bacterium]|nr:hypothetical protein [Prolixibacteraceae bacterium]